MSGSAEWLVGSKEYEHSLGGHDMLMVLVDQDIDPPGMSMVCSSA